MFWAMILHAFGVQVDQAGARFGLGLAPGFWFSFEIEPCVEAFKPGTSWTCLDLGPAQGL